MEYLSYMNTKTILILKLLPLVLLFYSCGICSKKIDCPGFKDNVLVSLFPYSDNQQLVFRTGNEQNIFTLKNTETTEPYQTTSGFSSPTVECYAKKVFASTETDSAGQSRFGVVLSVSDYGREAQVMVNRTYLMFENIQDTGFQFVTIQQFPARLQYLSSLTLGTRNIANVISATRDTAMKLSGIFKIYYTKTEGIVGYAEYPSLKTWVKQ
jgi:hypothetical protein